MMTVNFITAEIGLKSTPAELHQAVETYLSQFGRPLRWSITQVDRLQGQASLEAIVTDFSQADVVPPVG